jgi:hypothetical protein
MANGWNVCKRLNRRLQHAGGSLPVNRGLGRGVGSDAPITGNVGLYRTCCHLSRMGWNAMPTVRNARGVDIIAYNRDCSRTISIQVKTLSKKNPVPLGTSLDKIMGDLWVIANNVLVSPATYILAPSEVKQLAHR